MANAGDRFLFVVLLNVLLFTSSLRSFLAQETGDEKCTANWFVDVDNDLSVRWMGDDRNATVSITISTKDTYNRDCNANQILVVPFTAKEVKPKTACSNARYEVVATVTCDTFTKSKTTIITTPPDPPEIYRVTATNTSVRANWRAPAGPVHSYSVSLTKTDRTVAFVNVSGPTLTAEFKDLQPYTKYDISGRSFNKEGGWSDWSDPQGIQTEVGIPHEPGELTVKQVSGNSMTLQWEEPVPSTGPVHYIVQWAEEATEKSYTTRNTSDTSFVLEGLFPSTEYHVRVFAVTSAGKGPPAETTQKTLIEAPDPPELKISDTRNTSISVSWMLSKFYRGPAPTYSLRWKPRGGSYISEDLKGSSEKNWYNITGLAPYTWYEIQVRGSNGAGVGRWSDAKEVQTDIGVPSKPQKLRVLYTSESDVTVEWDVPDPPNGPVSDIQYLVAWRTKPDVSRTNRTGDTRFKAEDLEPYTDYDFKVQAESKVGTSDWTRILQVKTDISIPSEPRNLSETKRTSTSIGIQWEAPEYKNGPYVTYLVSWWNNDEESPKVNGKDGLNETQFLIDGLLSYTNYSIHVRAATSKGLGNSTDSLIVQTLAGIPNMPSRVTAKNVQSTSLSLEWEDPDFTNGPLLGYVLHWGIRDTEGSLVHTTQNSYQALGLRPYTTYFFEVAAETEGGKGPFKTIYDRTAVSVPSSPRHVLFTQVTDHCILLEWSSPEHPNGPTLNYTVRWQVMSFESNAQMEEVNATTYRIKNLKPSTNYSVDVSASTSVGRGPWTENFYIVTKRKDYSSAIIAGTTVGCLLLVIVIAVVALFLLAKKKGGFQNIISKKTPATSSETLESSLSLPMNLLSDSETLNVRNFHQHVLKLMANGYYKLAQEFEKLGKESPAFPSNEAKKSDNLTKNRWVKILPFDHTRVKLRPVGDEVEHDFINASYVPGDSHLLEYIATQGPLTNSVHDFWRMVWQESVFTIVMLTQCVERAKRTCERYWPSAGESHTYGHIHVQTISESITQSYIVRVFLVSHEKRQRHVVHLHYINWPVSGCPKSPDDFLSFVKIVREHISCAVTGPILVHCSAGIGRTGTFIAVDRLRQQIEHGGEDVDVYGTVLEMRRYRANMVQTEEQYYFIYLCIQRVIQDKRQDLENDYGGGIYSN